MISPNSILLTDLYQLTMLQGYNECGMDEIAVFEFFVRKLRPGRNFLMAAGLEQALEFLENAHFSSEEIDWLASTSRFRKKFLTYLQGSCNARRHPIFSKRTNTAYHCALAASSTG